MKNLFTYKITASQSIIVKKLKNKLVNYLQLLACDIIVPSNSAWNAPIWIVPKKKKDASQEAKKQNGVWL